MYINNFDILHHMNKRLREKLEKEGRFTERVHFLKNSATKFCGERRIIELYIALKEMNPGHELLNYGDVRDGQFRFYHDYADRAPDHLKNKPLISGVPLSTQHALHYIEQLTGAVLR